MRRSDIRGIVLALALVLSPTQSLAEFKIATGDAEFDAAIATDDRLRATLRAAEVLSADPTFNDRLKAAEEIIKAGVIEPDTDAGPQSLRVLREQLEVLDLPKLSELEMTSLSIFVLTLSDLGGSGLMPQACKDVSDLYWPALHGDLFAQVYLGHALSYEEGCAWATDAAAEAVYWLDRAVGAGAEIAPDVMSAALLGSTEPDHVARGVGGLHALAETGDAEAAMRLYRFWRDGGAGHPASPEKAEVWVGRALAADLPEALRTVAALRLEEAEGQQEERARVLESEARDLLARAAEAGDIRAQVTLAEILLDDGKTKADVDKAMALLVKAAESDPEAQYVLGLRLWSADEPDQAGAVDLFQKAAGTGHDAAQYHLGLAYETGNGVEPDLAEARQWYERAAKAGHVPAAVRLGVVYLASDTPPSRMPGLKYVTAAAEEGEPHAQFILGVLLWQDVGEDLERGEEALEWMRRAAEQSFEPAYFALGKASWDWFRTLDEVAYGKPNRDELEARAAAAREESWIWLQKGAEAGIADAQYQLGANHSAGVTGMTWDFKSAIYWLEKAARQGHAQAALKLGFKLREGDFRAKTADRDPVAATPWFAQAEEAGLLYAKLALGHAYLKGYGVPVDNKRAVELITEAAQLGDQQAAGTLAQLYEEGGAGLETNIGLAQQWYEAAAARGYVPAKDRLASEEFKQLALREAGKRAAAGIITMMLTTPPDPSAGVGPSGPDDSGLKHFSQTALDAMWM